MEPTELTRGFFSVAGRSSRMSSAPEKQCRPSLELLVLAVETSAANILWQNFDITVRAQLARTCTPSRQLLHSNAQNEVGPAGQKAKATM